MVNHYLLTNEQLIKRLAEIIEGCAYVVDDHAGDPEVRISYELGNEFWEVRSEILKRMMNE